MLSTAPSRLGDDTVWAVPALPKPALLTLPKEAC